MSREEIQKLLGGYATGTLSEAERRALFEAALEDQELFDALAKEEALREVLEDPTARRQLIAALGPERGWWNRMRRPLALALAGGLAAVLIVGGLVLRNSRQVARPEAMVADAIAPQPRAALPRAMEPLAATPRQNRAVRLPPPALQERSELATAKLPAGSLAAPADQASGAAAIGGLAGAAESKKQVADARRAPLMAPRAAKAAVSAAAATAIPAVEYTLLLRNSDGVYLPAAESGVFHAGDSLRLQVRARQSGYLNLFRRERQAGWNLVAGQSVEQGQSYVLPPAGGVQSDTPERVELLLVLSGSADNALKAELDAGAAPAGGRAAISIAIEFR